MPRRSKQASGSKRRLSPGETPWQGLAAAEDQTLAAKRLAGVPDQHPAGYIKEEPWQRGEVLGERCSRFAADLGAVVQALEHPDVQDIPAESRRMLIASLPWVLCEMQVERHEYQEIVVQMIGDILHTIVTKLKEQLGYEELRLAQAQSGQARLLEGLRQADKQLAEDVETEKEETRTMCTLEKQLAETKVALAVHESTQKDMEDALATVKAEHDVIHAIHTGAFARLRDGCWQGGEAAAHHDLLSMVLEKLGLQESLATALAGALIKAPKEHDGFGAATVQRLDEGFREKLAELAESSDAAERNVTAHAALLLGAREDLETLSEATRSAASVASRARQRRCLAEAARMSLFDQFVVFDVQLQEAAEDAARATMEKQSTLKHFLDTAVAAFERLKDQTSARAHPELREPVSGLAIAEADPGTAGVAWKVQAAWAGA